jgi:sporulation protein YlmC with PRC-barrel domain
MKRQILAALLLTTALPLSTMAQTTTPDPNAAGQTQPMAGQNDAAATNPVSEGPFVTVPSTGAWRVGDLQGKPVYGADGQSIGDISDVLISKDGSMNAVIIGVGGFLGIGEKNVAVDTSALQLGPGATPAEAEAASKAQADAAAASGNAAATADGTATGGMAPSPSDMAATPNADGDQVTTGSTTTEGDATNAAGRPAEEPQEANAVQIGDDALPNRIILNVTRQQLEQAPEFKGVGEEAQNTDQQTNQ